MGTKVLLSIILFLLGTSGVLAYRLPWDYGVTRSAYRIDVSDISNQLPQDKIQIFTDCGYPHDIPLGKIDFGLYINENIRASEKGTVVYVDNSCSSTCDKTISSCKWCGGGLGNNIRIKHPNGDISVYGHMNKTLVQKNQQVTGGQIIGLVGLSGNTGGQHLHYELWQNGNENTKINPTFFEGTEQNWTNDSGRLVCENYVSRNGQDSTPPTLTIASPLNSTKQPRKGYFKFNVADSGAAGMGSLNMKLTDLTTGKDLSAYLQPKDYTYTRATYADLTFIPYEIPNTLFGNHLLKLEATAKDSYGNKSGTKSVQFYLNATDPILKVTSQIPAFTNQRDLVVTATATDDTAGNLLKIGYKITGALKTDGTFFSEQSEIFGGYANFGISNLADDKYNLTIYAKDEYGNMVSKDYVVVMDTYPPVNPTKVTPSCGVVNNVWQNQCTSNIFLIEGASDLGSNLKGINVYFGNNELGNPDQLVTDSKFVSSQNLPSGVYYLRAQAVDNAGNIEGPVTLFIMKIDTEKPLAFFDINSGGFDTSDSNITVNNRAVDVHSGPALMRYQINDDNWSEWFPYQDILQIGIWNIIDYEQIIGMQYQDGAGNISDAVKQVIRLIKDTKQGESKVNKIIYGDEMPIVQQTDGNLNLQGNMMISGDESLNPQEEPIANLVRFSKYIGEDIQTFKLTETKFAYYEAANGSYKLSSYTPDIATYEKSNNSYELLPNFDNNLVNHWQNFKLKGEFIANEAQPQNGSSQNTGELSWHEF